MTIILNTLLWIANGFLVIVFFLTDHLATLLLLPAAAVFVYITTPARARPLAPSAQGRWAGVVMYTKTAAAGRSRRVAR